MTYRYLDLTRAAAALLVLLSHSRAFTLVDFGEIAGNRNVVLKAVYFLSGFGHEAVLVFFVLSGFLISGSVVKGVEGGSWTWLNYSVNRLTRLLVVLVPSLCLTFALDSAAIGITGSGFYAGSPPLQYGSGAPLGGVSLGPITFLGNLLFLQTMWVPVLGSNGPLWSLANEFWYYVLFPFLYLAWMRRSRPAESLIYLALAAGLSLVVVTPAVLMLFPAWLLGYGVFRADRVPAVRRFAGHLAALLSAGLVFCAAVLLSRLNLLPGSASDAVFAAAFAAFMLTLLHRAGHGPLFRVTDGLAAMSYSLYLAHFPVLAFLHTVILKGARFQPDLAGFCVWTACATTAFMVCAVLYALFESRTASVRHWAMELVMRRGSHRTAPLRRPREIDTP